MSRIRRNFSPRLAKGSKLLFLCSLCTLVSSAFAQSTSIAFASCIDDTKPNHPIWKVLADAQPDVMIFMGDNVYLDLRKVSSVATIEAFDDDYDRLGRTSTFQSLLKSSQVLAIWDDNDYGQRDGDGSFELKDVSKQKFLEFWKIDPDSERANRAGNYDSVWIGEGARKVQVILSDTRYFRSPWKRDSNATECVSGDIVPRHDEDATMLGEAQWSWLEKQLQESAALHIFVSGIQVIPEDHCFERWAGIPHERSKLFKLLSQASARSIILSGDRHLAETSKLLVESDLDVKDELYEFTSSSLTSRFGFGAGETNRYRVAEENIRVNNFGMLTLDWGHRTINVEYIDEKGRVLQEVQIGIHASEIDL